VSRVRIFRTSHALFVLLIVTFGLFLANTFWPHAPVPDPGGDLNEVSDITVNVFTDLPSQPDAPALGMGGAMFVLALVCALFAFVSSALAALALGASRCQRVRGSAALLN
jgi:hypothetical protein